MDGFRKIFQGVEELCKSSATKLDLTGILTGKSSCSAFARGAKCKYEFLSEFMKLKGGPASHDTFSDLFNGLDPEQLAAALTEFAKTLLAGVPDDRRRSTAS